MRGPPGGMAKILTSKRARHWQVELTGDWPRVGYVSVGLTEAGIVTIKPNGLGTFE